MEWEVGIIEWIQGALGSLNETVGKVLSFIGGETGLMLVVLIVLFCWRKETGKRLALIVAAVNTWLPMLKAAVLRLRPYMEYPDRVKGVADVGGSADLENVAAQGYSFPSMHSASSMALLIPLAREVKKKWMWITAAAVIFLVGVSRAVTGMHYPTDILAGWALGFVIAGVCLLLEKKVNNTWIRHLILLLVALLIFLDDPHGSPIFIQKREGMNRKVFKLIKFRSMVVNAEALLEELRKKGVTIKDPKDPTYKMKDDPRITRFGRVIRKTSIDELPQLINIILGHMSIVGPRPPLTREVNEYNDFAMQRLLIRPGLTCIWQTTRNRDEVPFAEWMKMDIRYIHECSFLLDCKLMLKTFLIVFSANGN